MISSGSKSGLVPDFSGYPNLVVIYLGMQVRTLRGLKTLIGFGPPLSNAGAAKPDGLLHHEHNIIFSIVPLHIGMRWYWRDLESLDAWAKSEPHRTWWKAFLKDTGGTGIWHETYHMRGGMEAIYGDMSKPLGFGQFLPLVAARGSMVSRHKNVHASDLSHLPEENPSVAEVLERNPN